MLKLFGPGKKKRTSSIKPGHLKIPIPMIGGVQYADMTESQISTLIGGGNKTEPSLKKSVSSTSSQRTNNTEKVPAIQHPAVVPSRSISSPPVLVMPKPIYSLPPTRFLLRNNDYEKTQVETTSSDESSSSSSSSSSSEQSSGEDDIIELFPSNIVYTEPKNEASHKLSPIEESEKSSIVSLMNDEVVATLELPNQSVTRTSDDSIRQYISASGSPFFINSSVSDMNNKHQPEPFSSPLDTSSTAVQVPSLIKHPTTSSSSPNKTSFDTASSFDTMEYNDPIISSPPNNKALNIVTNDANQLSPSPTNQILTSIPANNKREKTPIRYNNTSSSPLHSSKQNKVTRPASSSASSATIGLNVTPLSQIRTDKPSGNQTSEPTAFVSTQNNNNHKVLENTSRTHSLAISEMQHNIKKMALNQDLQDLKRTIDRMQQERISDLQDHLTRVHEQKQREAEILLQIKMTKEQLEKAIAGKLFSDDFNNIKDADFNAIQASSSSHHQPEQNKPFVGNTIEEEYMIRPQPVLNPSVSTSTARPKKISDQVLKQQENRQQPENNRQQQDRTRGGRRLPNSGNRQDSYHQASESYFPDVNPADFDYMHGHPPLPPQQQQQQQQQSFFATNNNSSNFRNPNMRNYHADMEFMDNVNPFDSPRRGMRTQQRRQRSKSMESQWLPAHELLDSHQYQQRVPPQPHNFAYDPTDHTNNYQHVPRARSRKSSTHSTKSNISDGAPIRNGNGRDLQSDYHSAAEEEEDCLDPNNNPENENNSNRLAENRRNLDGEQRQFQNEEHRSHNRYRRRQQPPPPPPNMHPSMMYPNFGPPPHMSHMGMVNDNRDRIKMRPPPPYGYNSNIPSGNEYYPYIPQRVSPRMMAAFTEEQQWNGPHRSQWPNQKMYGIPPPPQGVPENINGNSGTVNSNVPNASNVPHHLQDPVNENNFARRYPQTNSIQQQTPQQSQHGYMSMYGDTPHILYI